jgi:hypothetical protein
VAACALACLAGGCSSSELANLWKDPEFPKEPIRNVLVVALKQDALKRRLWEDGFADALQKQGVQTTASYRLFPSALPDTQQVVDVVRERGYDGVIVVHKLDTETSTRYVEGYVATRPVTAVSHWSGAYYTYYEDVYRPGYTETERVVRYQVDVWSTLEGGRLVWSGTSRTLNPSSGDQVRTEITGLIVPELSRKRVIPRP